MGGHSLTQHGVRQLEPSRRPHGAEPRTSLVGASGNRAGGQRCLGTSLGRSWGVLAASCTQAPCSLLPCVARVTS